MDCVYSRQCRDLVYDQVRRALDMVKFIVYDSGSTASNHNPTLALLLTKDEINFVKALRQFEVRTSSTLSLFTSILLSVCCGNAQCLHDFIEPRTIRTITT